MQKIKLMFKDWTKLDWIWLLIANVTVLGLGIYWHNSLIALISALTGVTSVIFISKQMIANYYVAAINVTLYALIAFNSKLYGDFMLNLFYYLPMQFYGIYCWKKSKDINNNKDVESKSLTYKQKILLIIITLIAIVLYSQVLKLLGGNIPFIDSMSTVLSIIAMILLVKGYLEQWYIWIIVNSVSIIMWAISLYQGNGEYATLLMWIIYLLNSIFGLYNWKKSNKK